MTKIRNETRIAQVDSGKKISSSKILQNMHFLSSSSQDQGKNVSSATKTSNVSVGKTVKHRKPEPDSVSQPQRSLTDVRVASECVCAGGYRMDEYANSSFVDENGELVLLF